MRALLASSWLAASIYLCSVAASAEVSRISHQKSLDSATPVRQLAVAEDDDAKQSLLEYHRRALLRKPPMRMTNAHSGIDEESANQRQVASDRHVKVQSYAMRDQTQRKNPRRRMRRVRKRRPNSRRLRILPTPANALQNSVTQAESNDTQRIITPSPSKHRQTVAQTPPKANQRITQAPHKARQRPANSHKEQRIPAAAAKVNHRFARKIVEGTLQNVRGGARLISARGNYGYVPLVSKLIDNATLIRPNIVEGFDCKGKTYGYYADQLNDCQIFHICVPMKQIFPDHFTEKDIYHFSFICPEYTIFSQDAMVCAWEGSAVPCVEAHNLYYMNRNFFVVSNDDVQKEVTTPRPQTVGYPSAGSRPPIPGSRPLRPAPSGSLTGGNPIPQYPQRPYRPVSLPSQPAPQPQVVVPQPYPVPAGNSQGRQAPSQIQNSTQTENVEEPEARPSSAETVITTTEEQQAETTEAVTDTTSP